MTAEDYKVYAKKLYSNAQSVSVFGGDSGSDATSLGAVSTAEYGKVFISIKATTGVNLTTAEKTQLVTDLASYTVASTVPVIIAPQITKIILSGIFKYNRSKTSSTVAELDT